MTNNTENAFTIAKTAGKLHLTVEAANTQGTKGFYLDTVSECLDVAFSLIDPVYVLRQNIGQKLLEFAATNPFELIDVAFVDGTAEIHTLFGGFNTDIFTCYGNGYVAHEQP